MALRLVVLAAWLGLAALLAFKPDLGLKLLWGFAVPSTPLALVLAPGLWRQICPMGFANQAPRLLGFAKGRALPAWAQKWSFTVAFAIFYGVVALRQPLFNRFGWAAGGALTLSVVLAFLGGWVFKGRSGWCGTFCPLGPIQKVYGQAPVIQVPQTYCQTCVGCQKNCYDLNPEATIFDDLEDDDPAHAGQRQVFVAMLPGLILAYFGQGQILHYGYAGYLGILVGSSLASAGAFQVLAWFFRIDRFSASAIFAGFALTVFYAYAGPLIVTTLFSFAQIAPPVLLVVASRSVGAIASLVLISGALANEAIYREGLEAERAAKERAAPKPGHAVRDADIDAPFTARHGELLLDAMACAGVAITANCRSGLCGSDAVVVTDGADRLSPPGEQEQATLDRLGLGPGARLACVCRVQGSISIDRNLARATAPAFEPGDASSPTPAFPQEGAGSAAVGRRRPVGERSDPALERGLRRVVIIGNGVGGATVADELRKASESLRITIVANETMHFYNRMAINKIVEGKLGPQDLSMQSDERWREARIDVRLGARAVSIDRAKKTVILNEGEALAYDKLVLATGARPNAPTPSFLMSANCFVLHCAEDATALRSYIVSRAAKSCVVLGAGVLAVETAETLARSGLRTTIVARSARLMHRDVDEESSQLLKIYLARLGVEMKLSAHCEDWRGDELLRGIALSSGDQIEADVFIACLGGRPDDDLAMRANLDVDGGICVDETMTTSDPDIFAVGDVARLRSGAPTGLWGIAVAQARIAADNLLGGASLYHPRSMILRLKSDGVDLRVFGSLDHREGDEVFISPPFAGGWWRVVVRDGAIVGAVHAGPIGKPNPIWRLVESNADMSAYVDILRQGQLELLESG